MSTPVAYLRKSRVTNDRHLSWEIQEQKVRELAAEHGDADDLLLLSDWNRSGGGTQRRPDYRKLMAMIEGDEVKAVYAYSLSRLSRSLSDFSALAEACVARGIPIRLAADRTLDFHNATGRFVVNVLASAAQMERELASERSKDTVAVRRARGDRIGHPNYGEKNGEDVEAILRAYEEAGSVIGAGRLLNEWGVPTRMGRPWATTPVREILRRLGALPVERRRGAKAAAPFILYHLLRCHCGAPLSASRFYTSGGTRSKRYLQVVYRCLAGRTVSGHGRQGISEQKLMPWVKAEAARLHVPGRTMSLAERDERERERLTERRRRVIDNYEDGLLDKAERDAKLLDITAAMQRLDAAQQAVEIPSIDWSWEPKPLNKVLRSLWHEIQLGPDMMPVGAQWRVPEWRKEGD